MTWLRTEQEVDKMIEDMKSRTKGKYITQSISFNKNCPRQMNLLKKALLHSTSFSGLGKELLAVKFSEQSPNVEQRFMPVSVPPIQEYVAEKQTKRNVGNFL